jgi:hypothetical protein
MKLRLGIDGKPLSEGAVRLGRGDTRVEVLNNRGDRTWATE